MRKRNRYRSTPLTRAMYWTAILGLLLLVLRTNAVLVAESWSEHKTQGHLSAFTESSGRTGIHVDPGDHDAPNPQALGFLHPQG